MTPATTNNESKDLWRTLRALEEAHHLTPYRPPMLKRNLHDHALEALTRYLPILLIASFGVLVGCAKEEEAAVEKTIRPVRYIQVATSKNTSIQTFSGTAQAGQSTSLSFRLSGSVNTVHVSVGDVVSIGDPIATMDVSELELQIEQARANRTQASAEAGNRKTQYERTKKLYESGNASASDLDSARAGSKAAKAQVTSLDKQISLLKQQAGFGALKAPIAGTITAVQIEPGEFAGAGSPVAEVASSDKESPVEIRVSLPETWIPRVRAGDLVSVELDALPAPVDGKVSEIGVSASGGSGTWPVTIALKDANQQVLPGMVAKVTFDFSDDEAEKEHFIVPSRCLLADEKGAYVFVAVPTKEGFAEVARKPVTTGTLTSKGFVISDGLQEGDRLITAGLNQIGDGTEVRLEDRFDETAPWVRQKLSSAAPEAPSPAEKEPKDESGEDTTQGAPEGGAQ